MSLVDALRVGLSGLDAARAGLETAQSNVANVNTPGYARRRTDLEEVVLGRRTTITKFGGAHAASVESIRSQLLDARVLMTESARTGAESEQSTLHALETSLSPNGTPAVADSLSVMFASFERLSVRPEEASLRLATLDAAAQVASDIKSAADAAASALVSVQRQLATHAERVNLLSEELAELNREQAGALPGSNAQAALRDRAINVSEKIASEIGVRSYRDAGGQLTLTLADGRPLVSGDRAYELTVDVLPGGSVRLDGHDVTAAIEGGAMGGLIAAREGAILPSLSRLDDLATSVATELNGAHTAGFDANGAAGQDLFALGTGPLPGAIARGMTALISDPSEVAAAATPSPGDGANAEAIVALGAREDLIIVDGLPSSLEGAGIAVGVRLGSRVQAADAEASTAAALRDQAVAARESLSGVSLDEEATDMLRYQRAYQASSRFLATVDQLIGQMIDDLSR